MKTKDLLDYETKSSYSVTVKASDDNGGTGGTGTIDVTITVTDVNEPPQATRETGRLGAVSRQL